MSRIPLEVQRRDFAARPLIAMPLAGAVAWTVVGVAGYLLPTRQAALVLFVATGMIFVLAIFISRFTGERLLRSGPLNSFDALFLHVVGMNFLCYAIAIPFFMADRTSLPLTVGVLTGMTWVPMSWIIRHWIGVAHAVLRTLFVLAAWYLWPTQRYVVIPIVIVGLYLLAIAILLRRPPMRNADMDAADEHGEAACSTTN